MKRKVTTFGLLTEIRAKYFMINNNIFYLNPTSQHSITDLTKYRKISIRIYGD
jgi:hypothetical protein